MEGEVWDIRAGVIGQVVNLRGFVRGEWFQATKHKWPQVVARIESQRGVAKLGDCDFVRVGGNLWVGLLYCQLNVAPHESRLVPDVFKNTLSQAQDFAVLMEVPLCLPYRIGAVLVGDDWSWIKEVIADVTPAAVIYKARVPPAGASG